AALEAKETELRTMRIALDRLIHACHGDDRPQCPILDGLTEGHADADNASSESATRSRHPLPSPRWLHEAGGTAS
ncbi:MAG: hypothetical protein KDF63_15390, partial [Rhodoferax sp.]|nr:hypothetical protein [Rhodoferax sp.]